MKRFFNIFRYFENVFPGEYGVPRPFYFPFQPSYWCGSKRRGRLSSVEDLKMHGKGKGGDFEEEPEGATVGVAIENLRKVFKVRLIYWKWFRQVFFFI